jgi:hypothetical protein
MACTMHGGRDGNTGAGQHVDRARYGLGPGAGAHRGLCHSWYRRPSEWKTGRECLPCCCWVISTRARTYPEPASELWGGRVLVVDPGGWWS